MESDLENQKINVANQKPDPTEGISHMPLSEEEKKDFALALKSLPRYIATAFGRIYQEKIREGGGLPNTSNAVLEAAVGKSNKDLGQAVLEGAETRADKQIKFWEKNGIVIPQDSLPALKRVLTLGYAGLNVLEATVLVTAGQDTYQRLLELETKGGVVDWDGGGRGSQGSSGSGETWNADSDWKYSSSGTNADNLSQQLHNYDQNTRNTRR